MLPDRPCCSRHRCRRPVIFRSLEHRATFGVLHRGSIRTRLAVLRSARRRVKLRSRKGRGRACDSPSTCDCRGSVFSRPRFCKIPEREGACSLVTLSRRVASAKGDRSPSGLDADQEAPT